MTKREATASEIYLMNKFRATKREIDELGDKFGHWNVYHYLMNGSNLNYTEFLTNGLENSKGFERVKLDVFLDAVSEVLAERDLYIEEMNVLIGRSGQLIEAVGLIGLGVDEIANRAGIKLVERFSDF